jgi:hypothetical protein
MGSTSIDGTSQGRQFLVETHTPPDPDYVEVTVSGDETTATSEFTLSFPETDPLAALNGITITLTQVLTPVFQDEQQVGALLTQQYVLNQNSTDRKFDLVRYMDADIGVNATPDGGGQFIYNGDEWLFTTSNDSPDFLNQPDLFVAIATQGGAMPTTNRYEIDQYPTVLNNKVLPGDELDNSVFNDVDPIDGFIDTGDTYDVTGALRTTYHLPSLAASGIFKTYTLFADGAPIKILKTTGYGPPRVTDIRLSGVDWHHSPYSYSQVVPLGNQHRPVYFEGVDRIQVRFDGPVSIIAGQEASALAILGDNRERISQTVTWGGFIPNLNLATWTLSSPLERGKYALLLSGIQGLDGGLDGDWTNFDGPDADTHTPDDFTDDKMVNLISGDGRNGGIFDFHVSVLPGDYNQDGEVTNADVQGTLKDGNADGSINSQDAALATANLGTILPFGRSQGDYADNEYVNGGDYDLWSSTFDSTMLLEADGNGNGVIDAADYVIWRNLRLGKVSAWYVLPPPAASGLSYVDSPDAARVTNVTISGSNSTHSPYSFASHTAEQLRTVPVAGADTISITFSENVNVDASYFRLVGLFTGYEPALASFSYDAATATATWQFADLPANDMYLMMLSDMVTDGQCYRLDGEWLNPGSVATGETNQFPSGDGHAGGNFAFLFTLLAGDATLNNTVSYDDYVILAMNYGALVSMGFTDADFNGDGAVTFTDLQIFATTYSLNLQNIWQLGDLDDNSTVNADDLAILASNFNTSGACYWDGDLNGDGDVNICDLDLFFTRYGMGMSFTW